MRSVRVRRHQIVTLHGITVANKSMYRDQPRKAIPLGIGPSLRLSGQTSTVLLWSVSENECHIYHNEGHRAYCYQDTNPLIIVHFHNYSSLFTFIIVHFHQCSSLVTFIIVYFHQCSSLVTFIIVHFHHCLPLVTFIIAQLCYWLCSPS